MVTGGGGTGVKESPGVTAFKRAMGKYLAAPGANPKLMPKSELAAALAQLEVGGVTPDEREVAVELFFAWALQRYTLKVGALKQVRMTDDAADALRKFVSRHTEAPCARAAMNLYRLYESAPQTRSFISEVQAALKGGGQASDDDNRARLRAIIVRQLLNDDDPLAPSLSERQFLSTFLALGALPKTRAELERWTQVVPRYGKFGDAEAEAVAAKVKELPVAGFDGEVEFLLKFQMGLTPGIVYAGDGMLEESEVRFTLGATWPENEKAGAAAVPRGTALAILKVLREHPDRVRPDARRTALRIIAEVLGL